MKRPLTRDELEKLIEGHRPVSRKSTIRFHGGKASESGALFEKDQLEFESEDGFESLDVFVTGSCDFNHLLGVGGSEIAGKCSICRKWVCTQEGCARRCVRGDLVCWHDSHLVGGEVFCTRHFTGRLGTELLKGTAKAAVGIGKAIPRIIPGWWPFK